MPSPWATISPDPPYVLPMDARLVAQQDARAPAETRTQLQLLPEPFMGATDAPVLLLTLNPGYDPSDDAVHREARFVASARANLVHAATPPFYLLAPELAHAPGARYWRAKLRPVAEAVARARRVPVDVAWDLVARRVACVEYFPYHSTRFGWRLGEPPSFGYTRSLVERAAARGALIVMMRAVTKWQAAVPALADRERTHRLRNPRNPVVSARNCPMGFLEIVNEVASG